MGLTTQKSHDQFDQAFEEMATLRVASKRLSEMPDGELASWQANQKPNTAEFILAQHHWESRRIARQNRAIYGAAILGIFGTAAGVFLGWYLRSCGL